MKLIIDTYGAKGWQIIADAQANADGMNAYAQANGIDLPKATVNDIIATTAFIGSIFGAGGGGEVGNAELLADLQGAMGKAKGYAAWEDQSLTDDPEAPTTIKRRFDYPALTGGPVTGSVGIDAGSVVALDPARRRRRPRTPHRRRGQATPAAVPAGEGTGRVDPTDAPPRREASNFLVVSPKRSQSGNTLAVMGPQLGYYYPEIVQQMDLHGPGIQAQGVTVPGASMYVLIGRTPNYAWSLTSAGHDVIDVYAEPLCNPDGSAPTRASRHYRYQGQCRAMETFDAGTLNGKPVRYPVSVHGPMIGTATVDGQPVALTRKRSTFGRDGLNLAALKDLTEGKADTARRFFDTANEFEFTFNWAYASRKETAFFSSGRMPVRPGGLDRRLPTIGDGSKEWTGFLSQRRAPARRVGSERSAAELEQPVGARLPPQRRQGCRVGAPRRALRPVPAAGAAPRRRRHHEPSRHRGRAIAGLARRAAGAREGSSADRARPRPRERDRPLGRPGCAAARRRRRRHLRRRRPDDHGRALASDRRHGDATGLRRPHRPARPHTGSTASRTSTRTCARSSARRSEGSSTCATAGTARWTDARRRSGTRSTRWPRTSPRSSGSTDPSAWRSAAQRTGFVPGLLPNTIRSTNRPTFQQVLELVNAAGAVSR